MPKPKPKLSIEQTPRPPPFGFRVTPLLVFSTVATRIRCFVFWFFFFHGFWIGEEDSGGKKEGRKDRKRIESAYLRGREGILRGIPPQI